MDYTIDPNALGSRFFSSQRLYSDIDWSSFDQIVDAYVGRIRDWYIEPSRVLAGNIHFAFSVMALNCLLIDAMSQFDSGRTSGHPDEFMTFICNRLPDYYSAPIEGGVPRYKKGRLDPLTSVDQVLYHGFRCGILHEAHIPLYCGVAPGGPPVTIVPPGNSVKHSATNLDCPVVIVNPLALRDDIESALNVYLQQLKNRDGRYDQLRVKFKKKFSAAFGIDVSNAR